MNKFKTRFKASLTLALLVLFSCNALADTPNRERNTIQILLMKDIAKSTVRLSDKIKFCNEKEEDFLLNKEDKKHLEKYGNQFLVGLSLLSVKNMDNCTLSAETQLAKDFKKLGTTLKILSIKNKSLLELTKEPYLFQTDKSLPSKKFATLSPALQLYLKKRVTNAIFDQSVIFELMDKNRSAKSGLL